MDHVSFLVKKALSKRGMREHAEASFLIFTAEQWLTARLPGLSDVMTVERAKNGELVIACFHSIALQECQTLQGELLIHLQKEHPDAHLTHIRIMRSKDEKKELARPSIIP